MTAFEFNAIEEDVQLAYIKPTTPSEAHRLGLVPPGLELASDAKVYVLHSADGKIIAATDNYDTAYGTAVRHDYTPISLH